MVALWIGVIVIAGIVEVVTTALVSMWFIAGGIAALIASLLGASNMAQYIIFVGMSLVTVVLCRPLIMKHKKTADNTDDTIDNLSRYIGKDAQVTEEINNVLGTGKVVAGGINWSARSSEDSTIISGGLVTVVDIQGSKMTVEAKQTVTNSTNLEKEKPEE